MRLNAFVLRSEAVRDRNVERLQRFHLPVEPVERIRPIIVGPTDARPNVLHAEILQMPNGIVEPMIFEMEPLADAHVRECTCESACTQASAFRLLEAAPCRSGGSRTSPRLRDAASSPAKLAADRTDCTNGFDRPCPSAARPCAGLPIPAPPPPRTSIRRPPRPTPAASSRRESHRSLSGHSWMVQ